MRVWTSSIALQSVRGRPEGGRGHQLTHLLARGGAGDFDVFERSRRSSPASTPTGHRSKSPGVPDRSWALSWWLDSRFQMPMAWWTARAQGATSELSSLITLRSPATSAEREVSTGIGDDRDGQHDDHHRQHQQAALAAPGLPDARPGQGGTVIARPVVRRSWHTLPPACDGGRRQAVATGAAFIGERCGPVAQISFRIDEIDHVVVRFESALFVDRDRQAVGLPD